METVTIFQNYFLVGSIINAFECLITVIKTKLLAILVCLVSNYSRPICFASKKGIIIDNFLKLVIN